MVFVSIGLRARVEVEALNMVEALGAYTRHRTVSILKKITTKNGSVRYKVVIMPAVSGQSINYGYSTLLVEMAQRFNPPLPVCEECKNYRKIGGFLKRATQNVDYDTRVKECVVEDLTGFLAPEALVRRTSPVSFSYMIPDVESAKAALDAQFHVRYNMLTKEHNPFTVESGTAIYMVTVTIDVDRIGRLSNGSYVDDREKRIELAFKALAALFEGWSFGAKKARYLPIIEVVGGIAAISNPMPFMVSPPRIYKDGRNYINDTAQRAIKYTEALQDLGETIHLYYFDKEGLPIDESLKCVPVITSSLSDMINAVLGKVLEIVKS